MKEGAPIRFLLVAFPVGLIVLGAASMIFTYLRQESAPLDANEAERLEAAALNRRAVNREDLATALDILTHRIGERHLGKPESLESTAIWLESTLGSGNIGYFVERQTYEVDGQMVRNLIAELPGRSRRGEIIVVGAHYDTVSGSPGANDNGSGLAALLSLARAFAGDPQARTLRFVCFVNEEPPYFQTDKMGSLVYAMRCQDRGEKIVTMLSLDTLGAYSEAEGSQQSPPGLAEALPSKGNFLAWVGDEASRYFVESAAAVFAQAVSLPVHGRVSNGSVPESAWSDHWSFWQAGYPGVLVSDTGPYRSPHYQSPGDTMERIDLDRLVEATKGIEAVLRVWANP